MKIGIVFAGSWGVGGGLHRALTTIIRVLTERNNEVYLLNFEAPDYDAVRRLHGQASMPVKVYGAPFFRYLPALLRAPVMQSWMILKSMSLAKEADFLIFLGPNFHPARFIPYSHNKVLVYQIGPKWNGMQEIMASEQSLPRKMLRILVEKSWPRVTGPSRNHFHMLHNSWAKRLAERDFGLKPDRVLSLPAPEVSVDMMQKRQNRIVSFGRFHPEKRHELAIEVLERVVQVQPDAELYLVGMTNMPRYSDPLLAKIGKTIGEKALGDRVTIKLNLGLQEVYETLKTCKVVMSNELVPEAYVLTLIEAMACGCVPVVPAVDRGAWDDILLHGKYGFGFRDLAEAVEQVERIFSMPDAEFGKLSGFARERAGQLGEHGFADNLLSVINEIKSR